MRQRKGGNGGSSTTDAVAAASSDDSKAGRGLSPQITIPSVSKQLLLSLIAAVAGVACYSTSVGGGFVFDDKQAIVKNPDVCSTKDLPDVVSDILQNDFWGMPMKSARSHKSYRPLTVLSFYANCMVGGLEPLGFRLTNIALHGIACLLLTLFCFRLRLSSVASLAAGLLYAVHPIHTEAVCNIVGRADLLSGVFFFLTLITYSCCYQSSSNIGSMLLFCLVVLLGAAGMFCKETGITVFIICIALDIVGKVKKVK